MTFFCLVKYINFRFLDQLVTFAPDCLVIFPFKPPRLGPYMSLGSIMSVLVMGQFGSPQFSAMHKIVSLWVSQ